MALISSKTIITSISLFHLTLAFFFLTDPSAIDEQALVFILGESMALPEGRDFNSRSQPLAFLSAVLALMGLSDLVSLSMPEELTSIYYWGTQAPLRFVFSMALLTYSYLSGSTSPFSPSIPSTDPGAVPTRNSAHGSPEANGLGNRVLFTFVFIEMMSWFWIWVTLREERPAVVEKMMRERARERERERYM